VALALLAFAVLVLVPGVPDDALLMGSPGNFL
jgi:hypothetical protein